MAFESQLEAVFQLDVEARVGRLAQLGLEAASADEPVPEKLRLALVQALESGRGPARDRLLLGEALGHVGDPRLRAPNSVDYWVPVQGEDFALWIGRYPVTNDEYQRFVDGGGYAERAFWSDAGWAWLQESENPWPVRAKTDVAKPYIVANQPVVGVTWHEAMAFATSHETRLPTFDERLWAVRGHAKRPYPWGEPFGQGNANTQEEVLKRPCAVGLYRRDCTPEGIFDLAGNVAEWCADGTDTERWVHPGAFDQFALASWAKARSLEAKDSRSPGLGFRLIQERVQ